MLRAHQLILLVSLATDGGMPLPASDVPGTDGRLLTSFPARPGANVVAGVIRAPGTRLVAGIEWPEELRPLATLDGPAVVAANAALQHLLASFPKESARSCSHSARAMEVVVGEHAGLYLVQIHQRVEKCGRFAPGFNLTLDGFELYAVSPDGKVLARYPYTP
jgi:hypothetical protein